MPAAWFATGAAAAGIAVAMGAFGAHGLRSRLNVEMLTIFELGVRYQMYHALALLAVAWAASRFDHPLINVAGWSFVIGIAIFSGSLYVLSLTGVRWLGAITPLGGLAFILGWVALALGAMRGQVSP